MIPNHETVHASKLKEAKTERDKTDAQDDNHTNSKPEKSINVNGYDDNYQPTFSKKMDEKMNL